MPAASAAAQPVIIAILSLGAAGHRSPAPEPVLEISGKAAPTVQSAAFYAFTPAVVQNTDSKLRFSIRNKPSWASFGFRRGTLYGTPHASQTGTYPDIVITVSDGTRTVDLPAFTIRVVDSAPAR